MPSDYRRDLTANQDTSKCWYVYRLNKGYFYGPGAPAELRGEPVCFGELKKRDGRKG